MYYFAYGSNMSYEQMRRLCGWHFSALGFATLPDHEFGVDLRGYVNIRPQAGKKVLGVLYELDQEALDILDEFEGVPEVFRRVEVTAEFADGTKHKAWVYMEDPSQFGGSYVKPEYLRRVIAGATENRLPEEWLEYLNSLA